MNRVSELIGDGRIEGWEIQEQIFPNILVTEGNGLIDKYYVNTFGDKLIELSENGVFFCICTAKSWNHRYSRA